MLEKIHSLTILRASLQCLPILGGDRRSQGSPRRWAQALLRASSLVPVPLAGTVSALDLGIHVSHDASMPPTCGNLTITQPFSLGHISF